MSRLKIAVVGAGHLGRFHARIAAALPDARLVAIVDTNEVACHELAAETGAKPLNDFRDLFGLVDAAIVATPTESHFEIARELLTGGIHVLAEKPITTTVSEAEELVELAQRQQLTLQVGHIERFNPALSAIRDRLQDPKYITTRRLSPYSFRSTDIGVVHDLMIHDIDAILSLVKSPVTRVEAVGMSVLGNSEDMVDARLHFSSGCIANLTASRVSFTAERSMQVFTDECCATIDFGARKASLVAPTKEILSRQFEVDTLTNDQKSKLREQMFAELLIKSDVVIEDANAMQLEQLDFVRAIRTSTEPQVTGVDGRDALAVAESILHQVHAHKWDGIAGNRQGPMAQPHCDSVLDSDDFWSEDDTVILRRKAG
ncbi:Gfo/Idh/MocA family protein [Bythopirellula polymerisocia]|uniref:Dehydrogenase n=1 Tax=Bythopirellula polymerisocia TaxID=2528003 RepID=A0A5C6CQW8_9BACT|nr:Gfo/Idh/MocA family oxidoreductase [Bythopirellula polymerisocia]TWU25937.1 Dehydrogenase [Bythopirellula polymerisocia]